MGKRAAAAAAKQAHASGGKDGGHFQMVALNSDGEEESEEELERKVFPTSWVPPAESTKEKVITAQQIITLYGVPPDVVKEKLEKEIRETNSCKTLPFTLLLVFAYSSVVITNDNAPAVNAVEDSIADDITNNANFAFTGPMGFKNIYDINSYADFYSWLSLGLVPLVFVQSHGFSESYFDTATVYSIKNASDFDEMQKPWYMNYSRRGLYINHNRVIGGIRLSQERFEDSAECMVPKTLNPVYDMDCVGGQKYELDPEMWDARSTADDARKRVEWFDFDADLDTLQKKVWDMERTNWLDKRTQKAEVALPIYNAEYGIHALIHCNFFFSRGGHIWKKIIPLSVFSDFLDGWFRISADITFCACLLFMLFAECLDMLIDLTSKGFLGMLQKFSNPAKILDWFGVLFGASIITMFGFLFKMVGHVNDEGKVLGGYVEQQDYVGYKQHLQRYIGELEGAVHYYHKFRLVMAAYPLVIVFRLFRTFAAQDRLAVVTESLQKASTDLFHFFIIFSTILIVYSISAMSLFGHVVDTYATISRTFNTNLLTMLGIFDWDAIAVGGRLEAGIWFWTFMTLLSQVLLNMLIAIVMDAYSEVKDNASSSNTMWEEVKTIGRRTIGEHTFLLKSANDIRYLLGKTPIRRVVPLSSIVIAINKMIFHLAKEKQRDESLYMEWEEEQKQLRGNVGQFREQPENPADNPGKYQLKSLKVEKLLQLIPSMKGYQAEEILLNAVKHYHSTHQTVPSYDDIHLNLKNMVIGLKDLKHEVRKVAKEPSAAVPERSYQIRASVENIWKDLRRRAREDAHHYEDTRNQDEIALTKKERLQVLEDELQAVRNHVNEELEKVSQLHWQVSQVREDRICMENAFAVLDKHATELAKEQEALKAKLASFQKNGDDTNNDATGLMRQLSQDEHSLRRKLDKRGLRNTIRLDKVSSSRAGEGQKKRHLARSSALQPVPEDTLLSSAKRKTSSEKK